MSASGVDGQESRRVAEEARQVEWQQPSFGKALFMGDFRLDLVHPAPQPTMEEQTRGEAFLVKLVDFLRREVDPAQIERDARIPDHVIQGLKDLGALGMKIPEEYGGLGLSIVYYNRALQLAGTQHSAIATLLSAHQSIGAPQPLKLFGTDEQKRAYLPRVATNEISAFLLTEPDVGSDPARMLTTATPTEDGEAYLLNGVKLWTTNGTIADLLVVMACIPEGYDGHRSGITTFVVEANSPGIVVEHRNAFMGLRGIENGVTRFTDVRVPAANVIGGEGRGLKVALTTLNTGRLSLPAVCAAQAKWCVKIAREWSNERVQWGQPIGHHDAIAQKIADMTGKTFALEAVVELASAMADEDRQDIRIEAALAKLYASETVYGIVDDLVQIRGGRGFETAASLAARGERPVQAEQALRDMRINRIFEGSTEIMHLLIAREAVDTHLRVAGDVVDADVDLAGKAKAAAKAAAFYGRWLPGLVAGQGHMPATYSDFGELAAHLRFVERASRRLARSTFWAMARYQAKLEKRQALLGRLVDIGAELFAMTAAVVRARMLADADADAEGDRAVELADTFCRGARRRVARLFDALFDNDDTHQYRRARQVLDGRYLWLEAGILDPSGDGPMIRETGETELVGGS